MDARQGLAHDEHNHCDDHGVGHQWHTTPLGVLHNLDSFIHTQEYSQVPSRVPRSGPAAAFVATLFRDGLLAVNESVCTMSLLRRPEAIRLS
jgi:hypothetical protein